MSNQINKQKVLAFWEALDQAEPQHVSELCARYFSSDCIWTHWRHALLGQSTQRLTQQHLQAPYCLINAIDIGGVGETNIVRGIVKAEICAWRNRNMCFI